MILEIPRFMFIGLVNQPGKLNFLFRIYGKKAVIAHAAKQTDKNRKHKLKSAENIIYLI